MRSQLAGAFALLFACAALPNGTQAENSSLAVIVFPGVQNRSGERLLCKTGP
jgi:hypothetical protein